jgi:hypothetical protein
MNSANQLVKAGFWALIVAYLAVMLFAWAPAWSETTLYNDDRRHGWLPWSQIQNGSAPWGDPILIDPASSIPRLAVLIPNSSLFLVRRIIDARPTWLLAVALGWVSLALVLRWLFRIDGLSPAAASVGAMVYVALYHLLISLPPLSLNQLRFLLQQASLTFERHLPLFYGPFSQYFTVPYFFLVIGSTLLTLERLSDGTKGQRYTAIGAWIVLAGCLPLVYFYHWLQYAALLPILLVAAIWTRRATPDQVWALARGPLLAVLGAWSIYYWAQTGLVRTEAGSEYMLAIGLQEYRYWYLEAGTLARAAILVALSITVLRPVYRASILPWIGAGIYIQSILLQNMQIVIGKTIQPSHFDFLNHYAVALIWVSLLAYLAKSYWRRIRPLFHKHRMSYLGAALALLIIYTSLWHIRAWSFVVQESRLAPPTRELITYLQEAEQIQVILIDNIQVESNLLFLLSKHSYLPWAGLSTVAPLERMQRAVDAWRLLQPAEDFESWLVKHSWQLFHMKFGISPSYSSTMWHNPATRSQVIEFKQKHVLPESEAAIYQRVKKQGAIAYRLDAIIYKQGDEIPACVLSQQILFQNAGYIVYQAPATC